MFEIVKIILGILAQIFDLSDLSTLSTLRKQKDLRKLGTDLYKFYLQLNKILHCGEEILDRLDVYIKEIDGFLITGGDRRKIRGFEAWLKHLVDQQHQNIEKLKELAIPLEEILQILDGENVETIDKVLRDKSKLLDVFSENMWWSDLVSSEPPKHPLVVNNVPYIDSSFPDANILIQYGFRIPDSWPEIKFLSVKQYLESSEPYDQLEQIRLALQKLRVTLEKHFDVQDIILEIHSKKP